MKILENLKGILVAADAANEDTLHSQVQQVILHYNYDYPILVPKTVEDEKSKSIPQQSILVQQNLLVSYQHLNPSHLIFVLILPLLNEQEIFMPQQTLLKELLDFLQFQMKEWTQKLETIHRTFAKQLDDLFDRFFSIYFFKPNSWRHALLLFYNATHMLKLPMETHQMISEELTTLEASSNSSNEEFHNCPRPSFILETCLFFNGSIVVSHMADYTVKQITKYILCHATMMQRTKQSAEETFVVSVLLDSKEYSMVLHCQQQFILVSILKFMSTVSGQRNVFYVEEMQLTMQRILSKELELQIEKSIANEVIVTDLSLLSQSKKSVKSSPRSITVGTTSNLLHYFTFANKGLFVCPLEVCHSKVEQLFVKYIKVIRHVLLKPRNYEEQKVVEYGIKVIETEMIPNQHLHLWIVGYMNPITQPPTEVYVCYEDGNLVQAQRISDLAHKLL